VVNTTGTTTGHAHATAGHGPDDHHGSGSGALGPVAALGALLLASVMSL
jgi:hypothetical protein